MPDHGGTGTRNVVLPGIIRGIAGGAILFQIDRECAAIYFLVLVSGSTLRGGYEQVASDSGEGSEVAE